MIIGGYQGVSLIDYPGVIASIIFLRGCNLMCPYCHNSELIPFEGDTVSEEEVFNHLVKNKNIIDGVCVTGGEPCLQPDLPEFLAKIKKLGFKIKLDTSGSEIDTLKTSLSKKLVDYVAMDIKHSFDKYGEIVRGKNYKEVVDSVRKAMDVLRSSGIDYEYRTTIWRGVHMEEDIMDIASILKPKEKYFLQDVKIEKTLVPIELGEGPSSKEIARAVKEKYPEIIISSRN
jgi:pyruvate formate lyase activating enzyme